MPTHNLSEVIDACIAYIENNDIDIEELLKAKKLSLSTAESCTGGGIAALITSVPGSSEYFNGSIVCLLYTSYLLILKPSMWTVRTSILLLLPFPF